MMWRQALIWVSLWLFMVTAAPSSSWAALYYVGTTGSNSNSCAAAQDPATPKLTIQAGVNCLVGGDTLVIQAGTYINQQILNPPAGSAGAYTIIMGDVTGPRPHLIPDRATIQRGMFCDQGAACSYIEMRHLEVSEAYGGVKLNGDATIGYPHHVNIIDNVFHDLFDTGFFCSTSNTGYLGGDHLIQGNEFYNVGIYRPNYAPGHNTIYNPGNRSIVEQNRFHNLANGVGIWHSQKYLQNVIVRSNIFYNIGLTSTDTWLQGTTGFAAIHISVPGGGHRIYDNVIYNSLEEAFTAIRVSPLPASADLADVQIYNNTIYNLLNASAYAIRATTNVDAVGSVIVKNNIALSAGLGIVDSSGIGAMVQAGNRTTGVATDLWNQPEFGTFTLKPGSAAIDAGAAFDRPFCGAGHDQGAFEVCGFSSASITANIMDVTMESVHPPLQVFGATGWSVNCTPNPDPCGAPIVASASLLSGSNAIARLTITGITDSNCTAGQIWTVTFNAGTGSMSDFAIMGGIFNQFAHSFTARAVANQCTGSGGPEPPANPYIYYPMNGNANDSSGANRHATTSGVTFMTAKYGEGMHTDAGQNDYAEMPYLNGVNPSTQSLTLAFGVYVAPADLGFTRDVFGVPLGTNQRFIIYRSSSNNWRLATQSNQGTSATEFSVVSGWNFIVVTFNSATDTATLCVNGVPGASSGSSVQTYTSYTFAGNGRLGLPSGFSATLGGDHIFDEVRLYQSVESCADLYDAWEPPSGSWTGTLSLVRAQIHGAKYTWTGGLFTLADFDTDAPIAPGSIFTYSGQIDCTVANCSNISYRLYYSCALCPSGGSDLPVPALASADGIEMFGNSLENGMLQGSLGFNLVGALAHVPGTTLFTSIATTGPDLAQDNSTVHRATIHIAPDAPVDRRFCLSWREQTGLLLDAYTPVGGVCVTVKPHGAAAGF